MLRHLRNSYHTENEYLKLIERVFQYGETQSGRNGNVISYFGYQMRFNLQNRTLPLLTTKKMAYKSCFKELFWFIRGETDNRILKEQGVSIWNANATREFLDSRGLYNLERDDLGPVYGHQWRHFNAEYESSNTDYSGKGVDQLKRVIDILKGEHPSENPSSRRIIVSAWNPQQLDEMALPPCHVMFQFYVNNANELSCSLYQRSGDVGLGVPFNIASYSLLTHIIAKHCGLKTGEFVHTIGDCHIYESHIPILQKQLTRIPYDFPKLQIHNTYDTIDEYDMSDLELIDYKHHDRLVMEMRA